MAVSALENQVPFGGVCPGTGLLRVEFALTAVVSVPPCRADVENIRRGSRKNTNPLVRALSASNSGFVGQPA